MKTVPMTHKNGGGEPAKASVATDDVATWEAAGWVSVKPAKVAKPAAD